MVYTKKSELSKRMEGSGVKLRPLLFSFVRFLRARFRLKNDVWAMKSVVMCLFCGKLVRYKSIILSVDEGIMALKIRVADLR